MKYTDTKELIERLTNEWKAHGKIIIDYDYDNTVYDYHDQGLDFEDIITTLRSAKNIGAYCYCFTNCSEDRHSDILAYLEERQIPCDGINVDQRVVTYGGLKPYFNILLDDRAGLGQALEVLKRSIENMRVHRYNEGDNKILDF